MVVALVGRSRIVLPGEDCIAVNEAESITLGAGLRIRKRGREADTLISAAVAGPLVTDRCPNGDLRYSVPLPASSRYLPHVGDPVVAEILRATTTHYVCHIGSSHPALLPVLAFDGATKTNRPRLKVGDVVYAVVKAAEPRIDVELSCCAPQGVPAKDWVTGEGIFGQLPNGSVCGVTISSARDLFSDASKLLSTLGERVPFEVCVGMNGRVWLKAGGASEKQVLMNAIGVKRILAEFSDGGEAQSLMDEIFPLTK
jgi:exosome complex component RRP40